MVCFNIRFVLAVFCVLFGVLESVATLEASESPLLAQSHSLLGQVEDRQGDVLQGLGPQFDIRTIRGGVGGASLFLEFSTWGNQPYLPGDAEPYELMPYFAIDVDQNSTTGFVPPGDDLGLSSSGIGADYYVDLLRFDPVSQTAPITRDDDVDVGSAQVYTYSDYDFQGKKEEVFLSIEVPLSAIGNDDGRVDFHVTSGDRNDFVDAAPENGAVTSTLESEIQLLGGRFIATVDWTDFQGKTKPSLPVFESDGSALMFFSDLDNWEFIIKVIDGCDANGFFWVFAGGATDVGLRIEVVDQVTGVSRVWESPVGQPAPVIRDTRAFATCSGLI